MNKIEQFNNSVNRSREYLDLDNKEFKIQIDLLLKTAFERLVKTDKALIIGAGNLSDFSLGIFLRFFDEIIVTDVDILTVERKLSSMKLTKNERNKIKIKQIEYTGFEEVGFFKDFKERIVNCQTNEKIDQVLSHTCKQLDNYQFLKEYFKEIDFIYVSPIYTQLVYHQIVNECETLIQNGVQVKKVDYIKRVMLDKMTKVIERFNSNLYKLGNKDTITFVISDVFLLQHSSGFFRRVKNSIKNYEVMEEIYDGYKEKYGMGLGDYGLYNLDNKLVSYLHRWLIWPNSNENSYIVKLKIYKNKGGQL